MAFDYSKLKGRIIEKYNSQSSFANAMEWSERTLSLKLNGTGCSYLLGEYSNKAKAMKVLDMIQEAYMEYKSGEIVGNGLAGSAYTGSYDTKESVAHGIAVLKGYGNEIRKSILFQMPEDGSVEA